MKPKALFFHFKNIAKLFLLLSALAFADEGDTLKIDLQNEQGTTSVEISEVPDARAAIDRMLLEIDSLQETTEIIVASDLGNENVLTREALLTNQNTANRLSFLPMGLTQKIAAIETLSTMNERYPQLKEKTRAHLDEAEKIYREKEEEYKRLRLPITLVKMAGVGVANFFIYYKQFNYAFLPTVLWAASTAAMAGSFQWKAPEINNDYRAITDAFFSSFENLKKYAVPENDTSSGLYKIRHQIVKRLSVIGIGGGTITTLYHLLGSFAFFTIGLTLAPQTLLETINHFGFHFTHLSPEAIGVGFAINTVFSSVKEILVDVVPSCLFSKSLKNRNISESQKRIAMMWGSAAIGGLGTIGVMASQLIPSATLKVTVTLITSLGAAYVLHHYALKEIFSAEFRKEIWEDFKQSPSEFFISRLTRLFRKKHEIPNSTPSDQRHDSAPSVKNKSSTEKPKMSRCRIYLIRNTPRTFIYESFQKLRTR